MMIGEILSVTNKTKPTATQSRRYSTKGVYFLIVFLSMGLLLSASCFANNLQIENVDISDQNLSDSSANVAFDISWDNSWRNSINHDAVWVFVKYSTDSGQTWEHATLKASGANPDGFSRGSGTEVNIIVPQDKKGCFIERANVGAGTVDVAEIKVTWDWGTDGLDGSDVARVKVFAVEMVYVPEGSFYAGDGNGASESANSFHSGAGSSAVKISASLVSDVRVDAGASDDTQLTGSGIGIDGNNGLDSDNDGAVDNTSFPSGYPAFYMMKYEITEDQWVGFFNTLTASQKLQRDITGANGKGSDSTVARNTVQWTGIGSGETSRPDRACSYLSWMDICAYADWAALRPLTELEYEKAAKGSNSPVLNAFAWGNTAITAVSNLSGSEDGTERTTDDNAVCRYGNNSLSGGDGGLGPVRSGIFATSVSSRTGSGAGYYGAMELSGNLEEPYVTVGSSSGRNYRGTHGDGVLSDFLGFEGYATNSDWPGFVQDQGVVDAAGSGFRGGSWQTADTSSLRSSSRSRASIADTSRKSTYGGRVGRTKP